MREEEGERLLQNLGGKRILMLRNHGPVVMGRTIAEMFVTAWSLQRACEIQIAVLSQGEGGRHVHENAGLLALARA